MHPGVWVLLAWVLGVALQLQQVNLWGLLAYAAVLLAGVLALAALCITGRVHDRFGERPLRLGLAVLAGLLCAYGLTGVRAAHYASQALAPALQGVDISVTGRVASLPSQTEVGERFDFVVEAAEARGAAVVLPERLQLSWFSRAAPAPGALAEPAYEPAPERHLGTGLQAGDRWRFTVRLRSPHGNANPHGFDRERWLWENGIGATGYVRTSPRDPAPEFLGDSGRHRLERLRQQVARRITAQVADARSAGVLAALVVGEQSAIELEADIKVENWASL